MSGEKLFFHTTKGNCRHATLAECNKNKCWYVEHLAYRCLHALHNKDKHSNCKGEYLIGYTGKSGAGIYMDCECLCHKDKYFSPLSGRWS